MHTENIQPSPSSLLEIWPEGPLRLSRVMDCPAWRRFLQIVCSVGFCWPATKTSIPPGMVAINQVKKKERHTFLKYWSLRPSTVQAKITLLSFRRSWYSCFTALAVSSSVPPHNQWPYELGHLSRWSKSIEMIHCAQASRVWTCWDNRTKITAQFYRLVT